MYSTTTSHKVYYQHNTLRIAIFYKKKIAIEEDQVVSFHMSRMTGRYVLFFDENDGKWKQSVVDQRLKDLLDIHKLH